jgi:nucleoside-diphosphate-sugar epimerase
MPTVLITGASGFIGSHLVRSLENDHAVIALQRRRPTGESRARVVRGEFHSFEDLRKLDEFKIDVLIHLAATVGGCSEEEGLGINVAGTRRLLRYLIDRGTSRFVLASSIAVPGILHNNFLPLQLPIPDDHPCLARDAYGLSKGLMEDVTRYFHRADPALDFTNLRFGAVVDDKTWNPPLLTSTRGPMNIPFAFLSHVRIGDVVGAVRCCVDAAVQPGVRNFNVVGPTASCDDPVPAVLRSVLGERADKLDLSHYEKPGHEFDPIFDMTAIRQALGFVPQLPVRPRQFLAERPAGAG